MSNLDITQITTPFLGEKWMSRPYMVGDLVFATNGHCAIFFNRGDWEGDQVPFEKTDGVERLVNANLGTPVKKSIIDFQNAINKAGSVPEIHEKTCECCAGLGEVEWEFTYGSKDYFEDFNCPECDGNGFTYRGQTGKFIPDDRYVIQVGKGRFNPRLINKILEVAIELGQEKIYVFQMRNYNTEAFFKVGHTTILIMPLMPSDLDEVVSSIEV